MRINENISSFGAVANRSTVAEASARVGTGARAASQQIREGSDTSALERVAAENRAAGLSRIRDASLATQLASVAAQTIRESGETAIAVQANLPAATVAALLES